MRIFPIAFSAFSIASAARGPADVRFITVFCGLCNAMVAGEVNAE